MLRQIKILTALQLRNIYGVNVFLHTKDKKVKFKSAALAAVILLLIVMLAGYIGGMAYGYQMLGMGEIVPMYMLLISSLLVFIFTIFKAGGVIFQRNAYDIISSLPVSQTAIVVSRFIRMYVEEMLISLVIMASGLSVYAYLNRPNVSFYVIAVISAIAAPLLPMTAATLIGAVITGISSRMKNKGIVGALLSILLIGGYLFGMSKLTNAGIDGELNEKMIADLVNIITPIIGKIYPPALLLGRAMTEGDYLTCAAVVGAFLAIFIAMTAIVAGSFHSICRRLFGTSAKHNYKMGQLKGSSVTFALYKRELRRYLSSGVYITNTIISPIMGMALAIGAAFADLSFLETLPIKVNVIEIVPFLLGAVFCMMPTTATSVSLEGKEWWIYKTLPLNAREIFGAKELLNISIIAPFYLISEIVLAVAFKPTAMQLLWLIVIPALIVIFGSVFGITVNLLFPVFNWENETAVVKQSASAGVAMLGLFIPIILALPVFLLNQFPTDVIKLAVCAVLLLITAALNGFNNSRDLKKIG